MSDFAEDISLELQQLLPKGELDVLVRRSAAEGDASRPEELAVKAIHLPSGMEVICDSYKSHAMNGAMAIARLLRQLKDVG